MELTLPITLAFSILPGLAWAQINENDFYYACDTRDRTPGVGAVWGNGQCAKKEEK
ncbi:unnamed protein product [Cercospora beticola]|nr:unnamed protein product [Cercospora beticola]